MTDSLRAFGSLYEEPTRNGLTRPKAVRGTGVKMVNMGELFAHPRIRNVKMDRVALEGDEASKFLLESGDLLFARQSLVLEGAGKCSVFLEDEERVTFESHVTRARLNQEKANPLFYYYYFRSHHGQSAIRGIVEQGAGASGIRGRDLEKLQVLWRPLSEQRTVSLILGALDDKIEKNQRTAQALERLARATFRAWFVDFEPVRAKAAGATSFPSMPQETFDALPDRLVASMVGMTPLGWKIKTLTDICAINPPRSIQAGRSAPYLDMKNMPTDGHAPDHISLRTVGSGARFTNGDTLVARITPCLENGKTAFVDSLREGEVGWGSTEYVVLRPHPPLPSIFAYLLARTEEFRGYAIQAMTGTSGRQRVPFSAFEHFRIAQPTAAVAHAFGQLAEPLIERSSAATRESHALAQLRDYLLPRLLSGQLRVLPGEEA